MLPLSKKYLNTGTLCERYDIVRRTLSRWMEDPELNFPQALEINGRLLFEESQIETWERQRAAASHKKRHRVEASTPEQTVA